MGEDQSRMPDRGKPPGTPESTRRRLLTGLAASPILFAISSPAVLGSQICSPSGFMSGTVTSTDTITTCGGRHPDYWRTKQDEWPHPYKATGSEKSRFGDCFPNCDYDKKSLMQILNDYPGTLAWHSVAALLNAAAGAPEYLLDTSEVTQIYTQWYNLGYYEVNTGQYMYEFELITFFESTYG